MILTQEHIKAERKKICIEFAEAIAAFIEAYENTHHVDVRNLHFERYFTRIDPVIFSDVDAK